VLPFDEKLAMNLTALGYPWNVPACTVAGRSILQTLLYRQCVVMFLTSNQEGREVGRGSGQTLLLLAEEPHTLCEILDSAPQKTLNISLTKTSMLISSR
jgi:hypothetical protein